MSTETLLGTRFRRFSITVVLGSLSALAPLSIDAYLPGLPQVRDDLGASSVTAQLSLTAFVVGLSLGQVVIGPLSDTYGRRRPLLIGMCLYVLTSVGCAFAPSIGVLDGLRFVEGFTGAAGIVIARAVVRDLYSGAAAARFFASLLLVNGLAPVLAPILGAQALRFTSWRGIFFGLAVLAVLMIAGVLRLLPETLPEHRRQRGGLVRTVRTFGVLVRDRLFLGYALVPAFAFAALFSYISGSPLVLQEQYGLSPQGFSLVFAVNSVGIVVSAQLSGRLSARAGPRRLLAIGVAVSLAGAAVLVLDAVARLGLPGLLPGLFLVAVSIGIIAPNSTALAMNEYGSHAGAASALIGLLQFLVGGAAAPLVGLNGGGATSMIVVMAGCSAVAGLFWLTLVRRPPPAAAAAA